MDSDGVIIFADGFKIKTRGSLSRLCLSDVFSFYAKCDPQSIYDCQILDLMVPWQKKMIHNFRVERFFNDREKTNYNKWSELRDDSKYLYNSDGDITFQFPSKFKDDLSNEDEYADEDKFCTGVWKNLTGLVRTTETGYNSSTALGLEGAKITLSNVIVDSTRYDDLTRSEIKASYNEFEDPHGAIYSDAIVTSLIYRAYGDQKPYWPNLKESRTRHEFPPDLKIVMDACLDNNFHLNDFNNRDLVLTTEVIPNLLKRCEGVMDEADLENIFVNHYFKMQEARRHLINDIIEQLPDAVG